MTEEWALMSMEKYWDQKAKEKDWDSVIADPAVYRYAGQAVKGDPRRTEKR